MQLARELGEQGRAHEPPVERVEHPATHVDDAHRIEVLMHRVATVGKDALDRIQPVVRSIGEAALAPSLIGHAFDHPGRGDHRCHGAQVVMVEVAGAGGGLTVQIALTLDP